MRAARQRVRDWEKANVQTAMAVGQARGVALLAASVLSVDQVVEHMPYGPDPDRHIEAIGGRAALKARQSIKATGTLNPAADGSMSVE